MQFINTAIIITLVYANFSEVGLPGDAFFDGPFYDYTSTWYDIVGYQITITMIINAFTPMAMEMGICIVKWANKRHD